MAGQTMSGPKPLFPAPIQSQPLLYPASTCHNHECDRGTLRSMPRSCCSCESISGANGFARLLPAISPTEQLMSTKALGNTLNEHWFRFPQGSRRNYESLLLNNFPLYGKFSNESYPSLDYALLANARRKNATRETTSALKTWLNEHKKNPYPTKGEKVMLAILTKMTLTQVSTWFANARRRLKKENKMTWSPRKKSGDKKDDEKGDDDSYSSISDIDEGMDVDVDGEQINAKEPIDYPKEHNSISESSNNVATVNSKRPSVIRTLESPTFNEIKDRFESEPSPVNDLQNWVNDCFQTDHSNEELNDFPNELTPPSTPIESKVTTFTSQKLFEAFDAAKSSRSKDLTPPPPIVDISPVVIFSSKQPVLSTKETLSTSPMSIKMGISSVMTPQPSPKNEGEFFNNKSKELEKPLSPIMDTLSKPLNHTSSAQPKVRVQGLTTSRELEAVLALTNLCKS